MKELLLGEVKEEAVCKGLFFRVRENNFVGSDGSYNYNLKLYPLKKISCPGCMHCSYLLEDHDMCGEMPTLPNVSDKGIVELRIISEHRDWETGMIDDVEIGFVKAAS